MRGRDRLGDVRRAVAHTLEYQIESIDELEG
jgi:hypothetical protein